MSETDIVYVDNNATTCVAPEVFEAMTPYLTTDYGNPSSPHPFGGHVAKAVKAARESVASLLGAESPSEIIFTSCGSESDNTAILSALETQRGRRKIVTTAVEHAAILTLCRWLQKHGVQVVNARGEILGKSAQGFTVKANGTEYTGAKLLICTGSTASVPPIPGLREAVASGFAMTNREILDLKKVPEKLVVIGGGVIGLEMASYFNSIGAKVTVIEMLDHIAGPTDSEIGKILYKNYVKKGVTFLLGAKVTSVGTDCVNYELNGKEESAKADAVLVSIGRRAMTQGIGLENIGVLTERGAIVTNEKMETNVAGVWAAGDVNGKLMLAHTAYREGEVAVNNMLGKADRVNYLSIPSVIYTNPEVASVGETTETVKAKGLDAKVESYTLKYSGRYVAENEGGDGIVKLIVDKEHRRVIGVHMIGNYASEIIYGAAMMVDREMRVEQVQKLVFPHPTVGEVIREAMFMI